MITIIAIIIITIIITILKTTIIIMIIINTILLALKTIRNKSIPKEFICINAKSEVIYNHISENIMLNVNYRLYLKNAYI